MRKLSTDTSAAALGVDRKTLDNILAREAKAIVPIGARGRSRRISMSVLRQIAIALVLQRDLGVGVSAGLEFAARITESPSNSIAIGSLGTLTFDAGKLHAALEHSVSEALESVPERPRGRPRT